MDRFIKTFNSVCEQYGHGVQRIRLNEEGLDERGHPIVTKNEEETKGLFHVNTGSERLILGHETHNYDAYILLPLDTDVIEGDEFIVNDERYKVSWIIRNKSHIECNLKRIKG